MKVIIYCLKVPDTLEIKYIGRTKNTLATRLSGHINSAKRKIRKTAKDYWIVNLLALGLKPVIEEMYVIEGWEESHVFEQNLIKEHLDNGFKLYNLKDKGTGHTLPCKEEVKLRISETVKNLHKSGVYKDSKLLKKVTMYDLQGNNIQTFNSIADCARFLNVNNKNLEHSLKRNSKRFHTFQIRRYNVDKIEPYFIPKFKRPTKSIILKDLENNILEFNSILEVLKFLNTTRSKFYTKIKNSLLINNKYIAYYKSDKLLETP